MAIPQTEKSTFKSISMDFCGKKCRSRGLWWEQRKWRSWNLNKSILCNGILGVNKRISFLHHLSPVELFHKIFGVLSDLYIFCFILAVLDCQKSQCSEFLVWFCRIFYCWSGTFMLLCLLGCSRADFRWCTYWLDSIKLDACSQNLFLQNPIKKWFIKIEGILRTLCASECVKIILRHPLSSLLHFPVFMYQKLTPFSFFFSCSSGVICSWF